MTNEATATATHSGAEGASAEAAEIEALAERYGEAWNSGDLDAVMELHTDDAVSQAHAAGSPPAEGKAAVRAAFAAYLAQLPDIQFNPRCLRVGNGFWVMESTMTGTVAEPLDAGGESIGRAGARVKVDCVDVIEVRDGLVARKDTYLDALTMQRQLEAA
jgi:steroid delta-isomerase-like uncharacterized protein